MREADVGPFEIFKRALAGVLWNRSGMAFREKTYLGGLDGETLSLPGSFAPACDRFGTLDKMKRQLGSFETAGSRSGTLDKKSLELGGGVSISSRASTLDKTKRLLDSIARAGVVSGKLFRGIQLT